MLLFISFVSLALALYMMQREIYEILCRLFGYTVQGVGFKKKHYSLTRTDALEWLACYDHAIMYKGRGRLDVVDVALLQQNNTDKIVVDKFVH